MLAMNTILSHPNQSFNLEEGVGIGAIKSNLGLGLGNLQAIPDVKMMYHVSYLYLQNASNDVCLKLGNIYCSVLSCNFSNFDNLLSSIMISYVETLKIYLLSCAKLLIFKPRCS